MGAYCPCHLKNKRALYLLLTANAISGFAQGVSIIAIPWYFINILDQEQYYGIAYAIITFATLFWSLYAGTLVDRYSRKNIFMGLNIAGLIGIGSIATIGFVQGHVPEPLVMMAFGLTIFIFNVHYPTLYAFGQEITEPKHYGKINSLLEIQGQTTAMIAGGFAAFLLGGTTSADNVFANIIPFEVEPWTLQEIFLMDASTYLLSFILIIFIKYQPTERKQVELGSVVQRFKSGWRFLQKNKPLFWFGVSSYAVFLILIVQAFFLMSMYVDNHLGKQGFTYALGEMLYAGGAIVAGIFIRRIFQNLHAVKAILILMVTTICIHYVLAFTQHSMIFFAFCLVMGLCNAGTRVLRITFLFELIPNHIIGRSNSIFNSLNILMRALFLMLFTIPFFTDGSNVQWAYFICASTLVLALIPMGIYYKTLTSGYSASE